MSSSEAYLDSLLSALNGEQNSESTVEQNTPISDDPNKALSADEIEALFAQANMDMETGDETELPEGSEEPQMVEEELQAVSEEPQVVEEELPGYSEEQEEAEPELEEAKLPEPEAEEKEEIPLVPVPDDPNKALSADEIEALFAQANMDMETGDETELPGFSEEQEEAEPELEEAKLPEPEAEEKEEIPLVPVSDDPNKALSADEIAALFAQADVSMETDTDLYEEAAENLQEEEEAEEVSIDDMLAQIADEEPEVEEEWTESGADVQGLSEEIEIDMDNPEEIELLLSLGERPDWSARKAETEEERKRAEEIEQAEDEQQEENADEILAVMSEENSDLQEINTLLNKLDNNELVGDGIEESILVDFAETDFEAEQDPWLDQLLGSAEGEKGRKKKKKRKKFSFFGRKKKENELQSESVDPEVLEPVSIQDTEEVTEILQNFSEDSTEIPVDLFAGSEEEGDAEELDLIALVEADKANKSEKRKKDESKSNKGFFAKMWDVLTEEVPEEEERENVEKKEKKKKKTKKNSKKADLDADDNEGILEELDAEEGSDKKAKKVKKAKKAKKQPKPMDEDSLMDLVGDSKKLPMKMVLRIFALGCSVMVLVLLINQFVPRLWSLADARNAFYKRDYETTYQEMTGKKLSESDQRIYEKTKIILQLNHKLDAYGNYKEMNMPVEALDSLLSGYMLWQKLSDKIAEYAAVSETEEIKVQIVEILSSEYQISEQQANEINALNDYEYTLKLEEITGSRSTKNSSFVSIQKETEEMQQADEEMLPTTQQPQKPTENVLPEEEVQ